MVTQDVTDPSILVVKGYSIIVLLHYSTILVYFLLV